MKAMNKLAILSLLCLPLVASAAPSVTTVGEGETYTLSGNGTDGTIIVAAAGSTITFASGSGNKTFYPHLIVSGGVVRVSSSGFSRYRFVSGIRAVEGGSLVVEGAPEISIDRGTINSDIMPPTGPICDIGNVTFTDPNAKGLLLRLNSTVRKLPTTCKVSIETGETTVALACNTDEGSAPIRDGNSLAVSNFYAIALTKNALPAGCHVTVSPGRSFAFKPAILAPSGLSYTPVGYATGRFDIELLGVGAYVKFANAGGESLRCVSNVRGKGEILFTPESGTPFVRFRGVTYRAGTSTVLSIPVDDVKYPVSDSAGGDTWQSKVSHWFDASDESTLVPFTFTPPSSWGGNWANAKNEFNGHQLIIGMKDKVEGSTMSLYNKRIWTSGTTAKASEYHVQTLPYIVTNGLNGMSYLCCGTRGVSTAGAGYNSDGSLKSANENRRLRFWTRADIGGDSLPSGDYARLPAKYAIMVFGSQNGGGQAVLGTDGYGNPDHGYLLRDDGIDKAWTKKDGFSMHVDGLPVDPKTDTPNGGWQVVSIDMTATNTVLFGLGTYNDNSSDSGCGGQSYAEVIFFSEKPTVAERIACERYLADKWGLFYTQWETTSVLASGSAGTVFLGNRTNSGYVDDDMPEEVQATGAYSGTGRIDIPEGRTLLLDKPLPPGESDVPAANRVGWYDPDFTGATTFDGNPDYGHADLLNILYGRTLTSLLTGSTDKMFSSGWRANTTGNFAPRVIAGVRGPITTGPSRKWMVFKEKYSDGVGNMIRSRKVGDGVTGGMSSITIRQAFFVTDTTDGGGNLFGDNSIFANGKVKPRSRTDVNDPIWSPTNTIAMTSTWLDTTAIDGTAQGYNGRPEVLSFTTSDNYNIGYVANWGDSSSDNKNTEVVGEFIFYSTPLGDADRVKVQEYLMYKWFGDLNNKYADYTGVTVTGAGNVKSPTLRNLPTFDSEFTGTLTGGSALAFTVDSKINASAATDALALDHALVLEEGASITVTVGEKFAAGRYTLLTAPSISGLATLSLTGNVRVSRTVALHVDTTSIWIEVIASGTKVIVR